MRVLLVEPKFRKGEPKKPNNGKKVPDESLWYPPLGLLKIARFHKIYKDEKVRFVSGIDNDVIGFFAEEEWDRVYISTLFTFHYDQVIETIKYYKDVVGGVPSKVFVGGIMASINPFEIEEDTNVKPLIGIIKTPKDLKLKDEKYFKYNKEIGNRTIDELSPDYSVLPENHPYAIHDTFYAYTSRGCCNKCPWCGVPKIEPEYNPYIDIKPMIKQMVKEYGEKPKLKLMDNNVLASKRLKQIVDDLLELGYGRSDLTQDGKQKVVDFNQGLDASYLTDKNMKLLSKLNLKPMRIAFDRKSEEKLYKKAINIAVKRGVRQFSNYMLYNFKDTPRDLYDRLQINIGLNTEWRDEKKQISVYSYPMRFAAIGPIDGKNVHRIRDYIPEPPKDYDPLKDAVWTKRFVRSIEIIKGVAHGSISPTLDLAQRTIGKDYNEFITNLYMPEELLRNRDKHERNWCNKIINKNATGEIEKFREFILEKLKNPDRDFWEFHEAISQNTSAAIKKYQLKCKKKEYEKWIKFYLKTEDSPQKQLTPT